MNKQKIIEKYEAYDEANRAYGTRANQIEFIYTKNLLDQYIEPHMDVAEIGCATGYYGFYLADKCRTYHGVDLTPKHITQFEQSIKERGLGNITASVGDACNLADIADNTYDVVLVFGPMYHLPRAERVKAILESARICKSGGIIMFAYINKVGAYLGGCLDSEMKANYPNERANEMVLIHGTDDIMPDLFFFTMPEEMAADAASCGLSVVRSAGVDFKLNASDINAMDDEKYAAWVGVMDYMFECESCAGVSNHAVLVCRKQADL